MYMKKSSSEWIIWSKIVKQDSSMKLLLIISWGISHYWLTLNYSKVSFISLFQKSNTTFVLFEFFCWRLKWWFTFGANLTTNHGTTSKQTKIWKSSDHLEIEKPLLIHIQLKISSYLSRIMDMITKMSLPFLPMLLLVSSRNAQLPSQSACLSMWGIRF